MKATQGRYAVASCLFCAWALGCAESKVSRTPATRVGHAAPLFPAANLSDVVSYANQVSTVTVLREQELPRQKAVVDHGEGYVGRTITVRVDDTLWTRPGGIAAPAVLEIFAPGWILKDGHLVPFAFARGPRLEVGGTYILPLVTAKRLVESAKTAQNSRVAIGVDRFEERWGPLSPEAISAAAADNNIAADDVRKRGEGALAKEMANQTRDDLRRALSEAKVDPLAMKYAHLPPDERVKAVRAERR